MIEEIKKPERTKKMSTPIYPPENVVNPAWNKITNITANPRRPSKSDLYCSIVFLFIPERCVTRIKYPFIYKTTLFLIFLREYSFVEKINERIPFNEVN